MNHSVIIIHRPDYGHNKVTAKETQDPLHVDDDVEPNEPGLVTDGLLFGSDEKAIKDDPDEDDQIASIRALACACAIQSANELTVKDEVEIKDEPDFEDNGDLTDEASFSTSLYQGPTIDATGELPNIYHGARLRNVRLEILKQLVPEMMRRSTIDNVVDSAIPAINTDRTAVSTNDWGEPPEEKCHQCDKCGVKYKRYGNLLMHIERKHGNSEIQLKKQKTKTYQCRKCEYKSVERRDMAKHVWTHKDKLACDKCDFTTFRPSNFALHKKKHERARLYTCFKCRYTSKNRRVFVIHVKNHRRVWHYNCHHCGYKSNKRIIFIGHVKKHQKIIERVRTRKEKTPPKTSKIKRNTKSRAQKLNCPECGVEIGRKSWLARHMLIHTGEKPLKCQHCDYRTSRSDHFKRHLTKHTGEKRFKCNQCEHKMTVKGDLVIHMRKHTGLLECYECNFKTAYRDSLINHLKTHRGEQKYCCDYCDFKTHWSANLISHEKRKHTEIEYHKCDKCDYNTSKFHLYVGHLNVCKGENGWKCEKCNYKTSRRFLLILHMKNHEDDFKHRCQECDYKSKFHSHLVRHVRARHLGDKPLQCYHCTYRCSDRTHLIRHTRRHSGIKPFRCKQCPYRARNTDNLKRHIQTHTGEKPFGCSACDFRTADRRTITNHIFRRHMG